MELCNGDNLKMMFSLMDCESLSKIHRNLADTYPDKCRLPKMVDADKYFTHMFGCCPIQMDCVNTAFAFDLIGHILKPWNYNNDILIEWVPDVDYLIKHSWSNCMKFKSYRMNIFVSNRHPRLPRIHIETANRIHGMLILPHPGDYVLDHLPNGHVSAHVVI